MLWGLTSGQHTKGPHRSLQGDDGIDGCGWASRGCPRQQQHHFSLTWLLCVSQCRAGCRLPTEAISAWTRSAPWLSLVLWS